MNNEQKAIAGLLQYMVNKQVVEADGSDTLVGVHLSFDPATEMDPTSLVRVYTDDEGRIHMVCTWEAGRNRCEVPAA